MDPTIIDKGELHKLRREIAERHGIDLYLQYKERTAADLLVSPAKREEGNSDVSTLKRKRRSGKIPHVPLGDGSIAYLGMMLCDFLAFGERSVLLWGYGKDGGADGRTPPTPTDPAAPPE